jgi:ADP-heptose:LPS heptosyltransferase
VTPLVTVANSLSYEVDVCIAPDDMHTGELLQGSPLIRTLMTYPPPMLRRADTLTMPEYDLAIFTALSGRLRRYVRASTTYEFDRSWRIQGDIACVTEIARSIGWKGDLPPAFAMKSMRRFELPGDTIALHPGCKPNWPWKKWHGFDELSELLPNVALIGTEADLDNSLTYFKRSFSWPDRVQNFVGKLDLRDTAALVSQCAAVVSVDSGMMHLGVALGVPTFGIFGITSPDRECIPSPYMMAITKQLPCEPQCRQLPWGRRDCHLHLSCLKALTAQEVASYVTEFLDAT